MKQREEKLTFPFEDLILEIGSLRSRIRRGQTGQIYREGEPAFERGERGEREVG